MNPPRSRSSGRRSEESSAIRTPTHDRAPSVRPHARAGDPYPLGAHPDAGGTGFSVFSRVAERVELCLFDGEGHETRLDLPERTGHTWHGYLPGVGPGQRYGYRVHGPWDPAQGRRCNPHKLLLDPYARAIDGELRWSERIHAHVPGHPFIRQESDSAPDVPRSVVVKSDFDWAGDARPRVPDNEMVIYETHLKGFTQQHPGVPAPLRGTFAGMAHPAAVEHLLTLGITSVELLPVHHFIHDGFLLERGLRNYWGYNTIGFFAPHAQYAAGGSGGQQVDEFKAMVKALHAAGLEVILDVVYNHTGEGNHRGPMISLRGFDNGAYYRVLPENPRHYIDYTGTGNTLDTREPFVLQLILDSLRYWISEMHVDGFRFDLASALAREDHHVDHGAAFFDIIQQDPLVRTVKLIAEPWDIGEGGYQVGSFPPPWAEWNGEYRDTVRDLWRGQPDMLHDFGRRFSGSADLFADEGRPPAASINFVTAHDGFTLADLVSYERKHNLANGDGNRDGESHNRSWNCGVEGATDDAAILALRTRQRRNLLATLLLSQGVPMLLGGDELGRTQRGNNNGYCHDSPLSWIDWESADPEMLDFSRRLIALRRAHPVFMRRRWYQAGVVLDGSSERPRDIEWCTPAGTRMHDDEWHTDAPAAMAVCLSGRHLVDRDGEPVEDNSFYLALNASGENRPYRLPDGWLGGAWEIVFDTAVEQPFEARRGEVLAAAETIALVRHSLLLARRIGAGAHESD